MSRANRTPKEREVLWKKLDDFLRKFEPQVKLEAMDAGVLLEKIGEKEKSFSDSFEQSPAPYGGVIREFLFEKAKAEFIKKNTKEKVPSRTADGKLVLGTSGYNKFAKEFNEKFEGVFSRVFFMQTASKAGTPASSLEGGTPTSTLSIQPAPRTTPKTTPKLTLEQQEEANKALNADLEKHGARVTSDWTFTSPGFSYRISPSDLEVLKNMQFSERAIPPERLLTIAKIFFKEMMEKKVSDLTPMINSLVDSLKLMGDVSLHETHGFIIAALLSSKNIEPERIGGQLQTLVNANADKKIAAEFAEITPEKAAEVSISSVELFSKKIDDQIQKLIIQISKENAKPGGSESKEKAKLNDKIGACFLIKNALDNAMPLSKKELLEKHPQAFSGLFSDTKKLFSEFSNLADTLKFKKQEEQVTSDPSMQTRDAKEAKEISDLSEKIKIRIEALDGDIESKSTDAKLPLWQAEKEICESMLKALEKREIISEDVLMAKLPAESTTRSPNFFSTPHDKHAEKIKELVGDFIVLTDKLNFTAPAPTSAPTPES